jgi:hypothetical protein
MLIEMFASLPPWLDIEGVNFELQLFNDGRPDDCRLCYALCYCFEGSKHYELWKDCGSWLNPFQDGHLQGFLYLQGGIETDEEFMAACYGAKKFLEDNNLLNK